MVLVSLVVCIAARNTLWAGIGAAVLIACMTVPILFKGPALLWWNFSYILSLVSSRILLSIVFFGFVTPISLARRMLGYDTFRQKKWKSDTRSVFTQRNHLYTDIDLKNPF
jgi:hypothetical protein